MGQLYYCHGPHYKMGVAHTMRARLPTSAKQVKPDLTCNFLYVVSHHSELNFCQTKIWTLFKSALRPLHPRDVCIPERFASLKFETFTSLKKNDVYIPETFTSLQQKDVYIPKVERSLHSPKQKDICIPEKKRRLHPRSKKDIYIPEAKRRLHPRSKKTFTSPRQKDIYIPEKKRRLHPQSKNTFITPK